MTWLATVPVASVFVAIIVLIVHALSAHGPVWTYAGTDGSIVTPMVTGNQVLAAFSEGRLYCLRLVDGSEVWAEPFKQPQRFLSECVVAEGTAVMCSDYGKLFACGMVDGREAWSYQFAGTTRAAPLLSETTVYVVSSDGEVRGFEIQSGDEVFAADTGVRLSARPALCGSTLVAAGVGGAVIGLDAQTGELLWRRRFSVSFLSPVTEVRGLAAIGSEQERVYVLDPANEGRIVCTVQSRGMIRNNIASDGSNIYFADTQGHLYRADPQSAKVHYVKRLGHAIDAGPYLRRENLYCLTDSSEVLEINAATGRRRRTWEVGGNGCNMAVGSGYAIVGTDSGTLHAISLD
jgi:outer membrane protein assembly factor BamB